MKSHLTVRILGMLVPLLAQTSGFADFERLSCECPDGERDLKVGLWAWPAALDFDGDGDLDLVVSCPCAPYDGTYLFRNPGGSSLPVFGKAERIGKGFWNFTRGDSARQGREILLPATRHADFPARLFGGGVRLGDLPDNVHTNRLQANVWREVDFDGDGLKDVLVGTDDWEALADALWGSGMRENYAPDGRWIGPANVGNVYFIRNLGTKDGKAAYAMPELVRLADGGPLVTEGNPMPMCEDWDGDGDLDIICGSYVNTFTYFENVGTQTAPRYAAGRPVRQSDGRPLEMDLAMITPSAIDWDGDGRLDVICGDEDGRVAFLRGVPNSRGEDPVFEVPRYFRQKADDLNFGALSTPCGIDWDGDGDWDILSGNSAGQIAFIENLSGPGVAHPRWAEPKPLAADGREIRFRAGANGSIQGPVERNWGYTCLTAADWDGDGLPDLMVNTITGDVVWFRNVGTRTKPALASAEDVVVEWDGEQPALGYGWYRPRHKANPKGLLTQWRTTPVMFDWNGDGLTDLVMLDHEGYLALFERARRDGRLVLLPPRRVFADRDGRPLRLAPRPAGRSGRRKIAITDVNGDARPDLLLDGVNADIRLNLGTQDGVTRFADPVAAGKRKLAHHSTAPTTVDFDGDGRPEILVGVEDGCFYRLSKTVCVEDTPFGTFEVAVPGFADRDFAVTDYGAKEGVVSTEAFAAAMKACASAGGGRVVVPEGRWPTGAVRLLSNCNLHLEEGAVLEFTDDPDDYPEVMTTWEGVECRNHSPLVYAYGCTNVAVTGKGTLAPKLDRWRDVWAARTDSHMKATEHLYFWCSTNCPVAERRLMALPDAHMRPHLVQFNRCRRVLLEDLRVRGAPFWTLHLFLSEDCLVRGVDVCARGLNNDGLDIEMSRNVLVEKCRFDQGDDGIVLKAGRNADGWRLATPTENVVIRDCDLASSESMLGIGSELSGGVRNVWMTRCRAAAVNNMVIIKTGRRRGGFVENIWFDHCTAKNVGQVLKVFTQYVAQWGRFPDFEIRRTPIRAIRLSDCACVRARTAVLLEGDVREPVRDVVLSNVTVDEVEDRMCEIGNCQGVDLRGLRLGFPDGSVLLPRMSTLADVGSWTNRFPEYAAAVAFLGRKDLRELPCGTYRLDGERTVAQIREEELVPLSEEATVHVYPDHDTIYAKLTTGHYMFTTGPDNDYQHFGGDGVFCVPAGLAHTCARTYGRPKKTRVCVISVGSSVDGSAFRRASAGTGPNVPPSAS